MAALGENVGILFRVRSDSMEAQKDLAKVQGQILELAGVSGTVGKALAAIGGPAGIAAASVAAVGTAAMAAGAALFKLTEQAANYGSEIHDAAQQTGLGVEAVQALKYAAEQSGSSFEQISGAVAKFSVLLGEAKSGNDKAIATLEQYGITARTTDEALAQAIETIALMTDHDLQAAAAKALFKDRTAEILPVIQAFDGDLPGLINHLRELGLIMSKDNVNAAHELGDQMDELGKQFAGVGRMIGTELMPQFRVMAGEISYWLTQNKGEVSGWAKGIADTVQNLKLDIQKEANDIKALFDIIGALNPTGGKSGYGMTFDELDEELRKRRSEEIRIQLERERIKKGLPSRWNPDPGEDPRFVQGDRSFQQGPSADQIAAEKKAAEERAKMREQARKEELQNQKEHIRLLLKGEQDGFDSEQKQFEEAFQKKEITAEQWRQVSERNYEIYVAKLKKLLLDQFKLDAQGETASGVANLRLAKQHANAAIDNEILRMRADREKAITRETVEQEKIESKQHENRVKSWKEYIDFLQRQDALEEKGLEQRTKQYEEDRKHWKQHIEYLQKQDELEERALERQTEKYRRDVESKQVTAGGTIGGGIADGMGIQLPSIFNDQNEIKSQADFMKGVFADMATSIGQSIGAITQNLANMAVQWIVAGQFSGRAALQMAAGIALGLAAQAGVKAIFEVAEGYAALAQVWWNPAMAAVAKMHFTAAAFYGKVAAFSGIAGVALAVGARAAGGGGQAGSAFAAQAGGGRGFGSGSAGQAYSPNPDQTWDASRNNPFSRVVHELRIKLDSNGVLQVIKDDVSRNGSMRGLIISTAEAR